MPTGRLNIARGHELEKARFAPPLVVEPEPLSPQGEPSWSPQHFQPIEDRLTALERLARLHREGLLSAEEYAAEKALLRGGDEAIAALAPASRPAPGPTLLGRIIRWPVLAIGLAAGLALAATSQPEASRGLFDQTLQLIGA